MKKLLLLALSITITLASCSSGGDDGENNGNEPPEFALVNGGTTYNIGGGTGTIVVTAPEMVFPTSDSAWCVVGEVEENDNTYTINLTVHENTTLADRSTIVTVSAGDEKLPVTVSQKGITFTIDFGDHGKEINVGHGQEEIRLGYSLDYDVDILGEFDEPWVDYQLEEGNIIAITVGPNSETGERTSNALFEAGPIEVEFKIIQAGTGEPEPEPEPQYTMADIVGTYSIYFDEGYEYNPETGIEIIEYDLSSQGIENGVAILHMFTGVWGEYIEGDMYPIAGYVDFKNDKFYIRDAQRYGLFDLHKFNSLFEEGQKYQMAFKTVPYLERNPLEFDILAPGHFELAELLEEPNYGEDEEGIRWGYVLNGYTWFHTFTETKFIRTGTRMHVQASNSAFADEMELSPLVKKDIPYFYKEFQGRR